jgi:hypothetical protein
MKATAKFYATHPDARARHLEYQKNYNQRPDQLAKRVELNKENRKRGSYADHDGKDLSHHASGRFTEKLASKNRGDRNDMAGDCRARGSKKK